MSDITLPIEILLSTPIEHLGKTWDRITVDREPQVGDLAAMDGFTGDVMKSVALIGSLTGVPIQALKTMKATDFAEVGRRLEPILGNASAGTAGPT
jgi:hypothetical protein